MLKTLKNPESFADLVNQRGFQSFLQIFIKLYINITCHCIPSFWSVHTMITSVIQDTLVHLLIFHGTMNIGSIVDFSWHYENECSTMFPFSQRIFFTVPTNPSCLKNNQTQLLHLGYVVWLWLYTMYKVQRKYSGMSNIIRLLEWFT